MAFCDSIKFDAMSERQQPGEQKNLNELFPFEEKSFELDGPGAVSPFALNTTLGGVDEYCSHASILDEATFDHDASSQLIPTPSPDCNNLQHNGDYLRTISLEASPVSSPRLSSSLSEELHIIPSNGSVFDVNPTSCKQEQSSDHEDAEVQIGSLVSEQAATGEGGLKLSDEEEKEVSEEEEGEHAVTQLLQDIPKNVKLPQRKGGMQLWQFLYALLSDKSGKYSKLIEWTSNSRSREFRLLEPEAIAIWWGEHKNKKNMSYDKLSRSLRYYYDKGIIRKIPGERYVYQFCVNPELMYKHIGNSECRPKLKPMPQAAQQATSEYQMKHGCPPALNKDPLYIAQNPVSLAMLRASGGFIPNLDMPFLPPGYSSLTPFQPGFIDSSYMPPGLEMSAPPVSGYAHHHLDNHMMKPNLPPMRKCRSFDSSSLYMGEATEVPSFGHPFVPGAGMAQSLPSVIHSHQPPIHDMSPPPASSGGVSPIAPSFTSRNELLDGLIEFTSPPQSVYSTCDGNSLAFTSNQDIPISWNLSA